MSCADAAASGTAARASASALRRNARDGQLDRWLIGFLSDLPMRSRENDRMNRAADHGQHYFCAAIDWRAIVRTRWSVGCAGRYWGLQPRGQENDHVTNILFACDKRIG